MSGRASSSHHTPAVQPGPSQQRPPPCKNASFLICFFLTFFSLQDKSSETMNVKLHFSASCQTSCAGTVPPSHLLQHKRPHHTTERDRRVWRSAQVLPEAHPSYSRGKMGLLLGQPGSEAGTERQAVGGASNNSDNNSSNNS